MTRQRTTVPPTPWKVGDILAFIQARLDEEEEIVETMRSGGFPPDVWTSQPSRSQSWHILREVEDPTPLGYISNGRGEIRHVTAHDPARVTRAIQAKKRIVDAVFTWRHDHLYSGLDGNTGPFPCSRRGDHCECGTAMRQVQVLSALASEWSDHPAYRQEWTL